MKNKKVLELVKHDVEKSIMTRWFIILNIVMLILILIFTNISEIQKYTDIFSTYLSIEVVDNENLIYEDLVLAFSEDEYKEKIGIGRVDKPTYTEENIEDHYIIINVEKSEENGLNVSITTLKDVDEEYYNKIKEVVIKKRNEILANKMGVTEENIEFLMSEPVIERVVVGLDAENLETKSTIQLILSYANLFILFLLMSKVQTQIMQEKTNKSSEYVLTNINERQYLLLKITSIIISFIIQIILLIAYYLIGTIINQFLNLGTLSIESSQILSVDAEIVKMIAVQLILSITSMFVQLLIQAGISSKAGNSKEGNYAMTMLIILNSVIYFYASSYGVGMNLATGINNVLCVIPIVSSYLLPIMMMYNTATGLQIVLAILFNILIIPVTIKKCSKIVKNGILGYDSSKGGIR